MDSQQKITPLDAILKCIESNQNFVLQGGAGSGKTETLKQLLSKLNIKYPDKKIACITHTNLAVEEIKSRVGEGYVIDTIHSFLYSIIKDYKKNMHSVISEIFKIEKIEREDISIYTDEKEQKVKEHAKYKKVYEKYTSRLYNVNKNTMPKVEGKKAYDLEPEKYNEVLNGHIETLNQEIDQIIAGKDYNGIKYSDSRFDNFKKINFGHNSLLKIAALLFEKYPLLSKIVRDKFDYILIDEYQDTHKDVVSIFVDKVSNNGETTIGFFGDSMQGIYDDGIGDVESYIASGQLTKINKEDNYRCSEDVITFINQIRNDGLAQKLAFKTKDGLTEGIEQRQGEVKLYYSIFTEERTAGGTPKDKGLYSQKLNSLIAQVQEKHPDFKKLVLTNKSISGELGFNNLYETFNARYSEVKEEIEKDLTRLQLIDLVELCDAFLNKRYNEVLVKIKKAGYELNKLEDKNRVSTVLNEVINSNKSALEVLDMAYNNKLLGKSDAYLSYLSSKNEFISTLSKDEEYQTFKASYLDDGHTYSKMTKKGIILEEEDFKEKERDYKKECFYTDLFSDKISFKEIINYYNYLEEKSEYITMHKTKGTGIENVMVILDEYFWTKYNFKTIFDDSETDLEKRLHNQKLFYVAASRTINNLVCIKLISKDEEVKLKQYFINNEEIILFGN
jgi:DNA helicase-2/ATP-dependent DNA helicase PcrA